MAGDSSIFRWQNLAISWFLYVFDIFSARPLWPIMKKSSHVTVLTNSTETSFHSIYFLKNIAYSKVVLSTQYSRPICPAFFPTGLVLAHLIQLRATLFHNILIRSGMQQLSLSKNLQDMWTLRNSPKGSLFCTFKKVLMIHVLWVRKEMYEKHIVM